MTDLARKVEEARAHVAPRWTPEREHRVRMALGERARFRGGRHRWMLALAAVTAALSVAGLFLLREPRGLPEPALVTEAARVLFALGDGTAVTALSADAQVEPAGVDLRAVTLRLTRGAARFSVTPNPERKLQVISGRAVVTVLGTVFDVSQGATGVRVAVVRGRVHVAWPEGEDDLGAGQSLTVPDVPVPPKDAVAEEPTAAPPGSAPPRAPAAEVPAAASWRALAQEGSYAAALARIATSGPEAVRNDPGDLLLAADVARLGGQPERAVAWLERVMKSHARDSRAALAAFTLGRTLLEQLGRPREAALAFAETRQLGGGGGLSQDALAREVEAWSRAGEAATARERALEYVERYPKGRRLAAVKRHGDLD